MQSTERSPHDATGHGDDSGPRRQDMSEGDGPLSHLTVLELAAVLAGPSVGQFLAEQGARVIKIENPATGGDVTRSWLLPDEDGPVSAYFQACNLGKESVALDLGTRRGRDLMHRLARRADIVLSSFLPGSAAGLGADHETLSRVNDRLIIGEITGYGSDSERPGYDAVIQAEAGYYHLNRSPGAVPAKMPVALMDELAAHQLKEGILLALYERERTGRGAHVTVSLMDAALAGLANQATAWLAVGRAPEPSGSAHPVISPYGTVFETAGGDYVVLAVGSDRQFRDLCALLDLENVADDRRFIDNESRVRNRDRLEAVLAAAVREHARNAFLDACHERRIPAGAVRSVDEALSDAGPSVFATLSDGEKRGLRQYVGRGARTPSAMSPPPEFGSATRRVLMDDLGLSADEFRELLHEGTVAESR